MPPGIVTVVIVVRVGCSVMQIQSPKRKKPFDMLVEGLELSKSLGDSTPIELFLEGVRVWKPGIRELLVVTP